MAIFLREKLEVFFFASCLQIYSMTVRYAVNVACNTYYVKLVEYTDA